MRVWPLRWPCAVLWGAAVACLTFGLPVSLYLGGEFSDSARSGWAAPQPTMPPGRTEAVDRRHSTARRSWAQITSGSVTRQASDRYIHIYRAGQGMGWQENGATTDENSRSYLTLRAR